MKLKVNLYGSTFKHNIINNKITSTQTKQPQYIEYVEDGTGTINLFVDRAIYDMKEIKNGLVNYGWLLESHGITKDLEEYFLKDTSLKIKDFQSIFTHNKKLLEIDEKFKFLHPIGFWVNNFENLNKTKLISMITSNKKHTPLAIKRYNFAKKHKNEIDVFGSGFHTIYKKEIGLNNYCFSVVVENDLTPDYFSEKLLDCFATKTIPIYLGCKNISKYFDEKGIIPLEDFDINNISESLYFNLQSHVEKNFKLVQKYRSPEDSMYKNYLEKISS
jgi:hypothetical protein